MITLNLNVCVLARIWNIYVTHIYIPDIIFREQWDVSCPVHVFCRCCYSKGSETNYHSDVHFCAVRTFLDLLHSINICIHSAVYNVTLTLLWVVTCFVLQCEQITHILLLNV